MKKYILFTFILCVFVLLISTSALAVERSFIERALEKGEPVENLEVSRLPANLKIIDNEAFSGTAIPSIQFPQGVSYIGEEAFADNKALQHVFFMQDNLEMADSALSGSVPILAGFNNSDAQKWAQKNGFRYHIEFSLTTVSPRESRFIAKLERINGDIQRTEKSKETIAVIRKVKRPGRITGELKAERYKGVAAVHIQSRYFP